MKYSKHLSSYYSKMSKCSTYDVLQSLKIVFILVNSKVLMRPLGFGELGRRDIYFLGSGEQAHTLGVLWSTAKKVRVSSGIWGNQSIIFRNQGSTDPPCRGLTDGMRRSLAFHLGLHCQKTIKGFHSKQFGDIDISSMSDPVVQPI